MHGRNLTVGKFDEHPLNTEIENATPTNKSLPTTNGNRQHLVGLDRNSASDPPLPLGTEDRMPEIFFQ
jgi:hypothetical protein